MAGTGAMYGALDVGLLITRSESGARRLRLEVEARDFASPNPLGIVIHGVGSGEHGGFTYADTAVLGIDPAAAEERDLAVEIEELFADGTWRTLEEVASKKDGIGANKDDVRKTLEGAPGGFVLVHDDGRRVGRHATARPWGTAAMLAVLDEVEKVDQAFEPPGLAGLAPAETPAELLGEQVAPPKGEPVEPPAPPRDAEVDREVDQGASTSLGGDVPDSRFCDACDDRDRRARCAATLRCAEIDRAALARALQQEGETRS
jgi:hypothetical protein